MHIRLRPVIENDREFLFELRRITMREYVASTWGWDEAWQRRDFDARFNPAVQQVILAEEVPIGFVHVERKNNEILIADMQVVPSYQGRGIGTDVIRGILSEAKLSRLPVALQVLKVNERAVRLYGRLGFRVTREEPPNIHMLALPG